MAQRKAGRLKKAAIVMILALFVSCVLGACSGSGATVSNAISSSSTMSASSSSTELPQRNGFDEATNIVSAVYDVGFPLPSYFEEQKTSDSMRGYAAKIDDGSKDLALAIFYKSDGSKASSIERFEEKKQDAVIMGLNGQKMFQNVKVTGVDEGTVAGLPSGIYSLSGEFVQNNAKAPFTAKGAIFLSSSMEYGVAYFIQVSGSKYDYASDFDRIIASAAIVEQAPAPAEPAAGVTPSLKETLDSYEAFMDEYVAFMQKYKESGDVTSMMADYAKFMQRYADFAAKVDAMDTSTMSDADAAYYIEVTTRVSSKLLNAAV